MNTDTTIFLYYPIPIILSFSLSFVLPSVINTFKKNIHSLLNFTTTTTHTQSHRSLISGLSLLLNKSDRFSNVLQSTMLNLNSNPSTITGISEINFPPPKIGFVAGDVGGLTSCTESLGFESSDGMDVIDDSVKVINDNDEIWRNKMMMKRCENRGNLMRSFPPPLSSLNRNGKPCFYLRPVRKDGRLELTEVRIHRPEILHASRHDGRLTLHLIPDQEELQEEEESQEEEEEEELQEEEEDRVKMAMVVGSSSNEGLRRCHEMVNQHEHGVHGNHMRMCGISIV
ncbi:uncharacterized protein [Cicer arietinum]|uniref:Protein FANTASTIC FOUR 1-like n=1 Tax=Cicer arietinum TaxID=3827 RepID=A0A1S2XUC2_CICAR|nr:protein FANTASTIC FOUR 1-like [Cicer arietinum]